MERVINDVHWRGELVREWIGHIQGVPRFSTGTCVGEQIALCVRNDNAKHAAWFQGTVAMREESGELLSGLEMLDEMFGSNSLQDIIGEGKRPSAVVFDDLWARRP